MEKLSAILALVRSWDAIDMTRRQAFHLAKNRAGVPRSQQSIRQWQVSDDITRVGSQNLGTARIQGLWSILPI
jgi:hypothetical protein